MQEIEEHLIGSHNLKNGGQSSKWNLSFEAEGIITLRNLIREEMPSYLTPSFLDQHRKQLETILFLFHVRQTDQTGVKTWLLTKKLSELLYLQSYLLSNKLANFPPFPPQDQITNGRFAHTLCCRLAEFLNSISSNQSIRSDPYYWIFLENSLPLSRKSLQIYKQVELDRFPGGRYSEGFFARVLHSLTPWLPKWFTVCSEGVYYTANPNSFLIEEMISFSPSFYLKIGEAETGHPYGVDIVSSHRILSIDARNLTDLVLFVQAINQAMRDSQLISFNRYSCFAPERQNCESKFHVDGANYFRAVYENLKEAKAEVLISGWMVSSHFKLCRPDPENSSRFDNIIKTLASRGVKINILVYIHPEIFSKVDSQYTQKYLSSLSTNITVIRQPTYLLIPELWSHHEKFILIDTQLAFLGGIDIGYGRYDNQNHSLADPQAIIWPGIDYCNYRIREVKHPHNFLTSSIDRQTDPRLPWHDIGVQIRGQSVKDLRRHFLQQWNHAVNQVNASNKQLLLHTDIVDPTQPMSSQIHKSTRAEIQIRKEKQKFMVPWMLSSEANTAGETTYLNRLGGRTFGIPDISQEIPTIQRKRPEESLRDQFPNSNYQKEEKIKKSASINSEPPRLFQKISSRKKQSNRQKHQILRSAPSWSVGLEKGKEEKSILYAYLDLITNAKEFIYIQNQFFICVQNGISNAIVDRILRAMKDRQPFRVVILIPSMPGFDGEPDNDKDVILRAQIHYMYQTICRGQNSVLNRLADLEHIEQYIEFFSLRKHDKINGIPVTELIYIHSKLMIIDDRIAIIGSANINDRSMMGCRDTEVNVVIEEGPFLKINISGNSSMSDLPGSDKLPNVRLVSKSIHALRKQLYIEHFGITQKEAEDYFNNDVWDSIREHAKMNQIFYREIFGCYPDNQIRNFTQLQERRKMRRNLLAEDINVKLEAIKGKAILFQRHFLEEENLQIKIHQRQYILPTFTFT